MNERAGRAGPQRAPPSGLCGGLGSRTGAAAWAPRVRCACVRACVPACGGRFAHCACVPGEALSQCACASHAAAWPWNRSRARGGFCSAAAAKRPAGQGAPRLEPDAAGRRGWGLGCPFDPRGALPGQAQPGRMGSQGFRKQYWFWGTREGCLGMQVPGSLPGLLGSRAACLLRSALLSFGPWVVALVVPRPGTRSL